MKENELKRKVAKLKKLVDETNTLMAELDAANVEVRINYVESKQSADIRQGITIWRIVQHTDYLG